MLKNKIKKMHTHKHTHSPTVNVLTAVPGSIHYTLPCKLNREKTVTLTLPYSALSMWLYDLFVCHLAFKLKKMNLKKKKHASASLFVYICGRRKKNTIVLLSVHFEAVIVSTIVTGNVAFK